MSNLPLTQAAFLRLSCNPQVVGRTVFPSEAMDILHNNTSLPEYEFCPDELTVYDVLSPLVGRVVGQQQNTDAYILGLVIHRNDVLATLDQRISALIPDASIHPLEIT